MRRNLWVFGVVVCFACGAGLALAQKGGQKGGKDLELTADFRAGEFAPLVNDELGGDSQGVHYEHGQGARVLLLGGGKNKGSLEFRVGGREKGGNLYRDFFLRFDAVDCVQGPCSPPFTGGDFIGVDDLWANLWTRGPDLLEIRDNGQPFQGSVNLRLTFQYSNADGTQGWLLDWAAPETTASCPAGSAKPADLSYDPATDTFVISANDVTNPLACLATWSGGPHAGSYANSFSLTLKPK